MKQTPIKLGPLALLLTVVCLCLVTLSILSFSTSQADDRMSERYASTVTTRQALTGEGQKFLFDADEQLATTGRLSKTETTLTKDGFTLTIRLKQTGDTYEIAEWKLERQWHESHDLELWEGQ